MNHLIVAIKMNLMLVNLTRFNYTKQYFGDDMIKQLWKILLWTVNPDRDECIYNNVWCLRGFRSYLQTRVGGNSELHKNRV